MNTMLIDGVNVTTQSLYLLRVPPVVKPSRRTRLITIPGRSGYLTEWSGDYDAYSKEPEFLFRGASLSTAMDFLRSASLITFGNEPLYAYEARADEVIESAMGKAGDYTIRASYTVQPLKRLATETPSTGALSYNLTNPGNEISYPKIIVTGAGAKTLTVGGQVINIAFAAGGETITIDSLNGHVYNADGTSAWIKITGTLPTLPIGAATISTTGTALTIHPNWRWS